MFFYLLIGAIVFVRIEKPVETIEMDAYLEFRQEWTKRLLTNGFTEEEIDSLFANIRDASLAGVWMQNNVTSETNWNFWQAFFFAGTLISTVGYGHVSPRTPTGKLFTIIYCIIGIPLTLALLSALAVRFRQPSVWLRSKMNTYFGQMFHAKHIQLIHLASISLLVLILAFIIPSLLFVSIEDDWTFLDAFYYCFISLTTIGLGEYTPGDKPGQPFKSLYKFMITVYLILGLCCMMLFLATLYDIPQFNLARFFLTKSDSDDEGKPIHNIQNGGPKYMKYDEEETLSMDGRTPFTAINSYYQ
uniref:Two pore potassium channel protein sup-9 n=1 Tax=Acrobeloides nanus TaxID=290746 RepID=A0A914C1X5_9BILA